MFTFTLIFILLIFRSFFLAGEHKFIMIMREILILNPPWICFCMSKLPVDFRSVFFFHPISLSPSSFVLVLHILLYIHIFGITNTNIQLLKVKALHVPKSLHFMLTCRTNDILVAWLCPRSKRKPSAWPARLVGKLESINHIVALVNTWSREIYGRRKRRRWQSWTKW